MAVPGRRPTRDEVVGQAFAEHAERLHRSIERSSAPEARHCAEDACAVAWAKLYQRDDVEITPDSNWQGWMYVVARREHWRLVNEAKRDLSLDAVSGGVEDPGAGASAAAFPSGTDVHREVAAKEDLGLLRELPDQRRVALFLQAAGHSYKEIGELVGASPSLVNRSIAKGRQRMRELDRERSLMPHERQQDVPRPAGMRAPRLPEVHHDLEL